MRASLCRCRAFVICTYCWIFAAARGWFKRRINYLGEMGTEAAPAGGLRHQNLQPRISANTIRARRVLVTTARTASVRGKRSLTYGDPYGSPETDNRIALGNSLTTVDVSSWLNLGFEPLTSRQVSASPFTVFSICKNINSNL